jgi:cobalt-zinc-cadmium efflux system outer membrane protein
MVQSFQVLSAAESAADSLTLNEAIQRTFNHNPELQTFQYQLEAQRGRMIQADLSSRPEVSLSIEDALGTGDLSGFDSAQTTLSVGWILDQNIKDKRVQVATQGKNLIESEKIIKQLDSATQTARYFLAALSYQESAVIASRAIGLAETTVKEVNKRVTVGKTPLAELYRAEAELAKRRLVLVDVKHELESSIRQLASQWGSTNPTFKLVSGTLINRPNVVSFHALKTQIKNNPNLSKYLSVDRVTEAQLKLAEEERNPQWKFTTGVRRYERTDNFGIVAGISIPFGGSNRNQGRIAEVKAKLSQNQSEADALRIRIETTLFIVYQQLEHGLHLSDMLKKEIIPKLEKALTETHKAYELGKYSYFEWLAVQNELLDAQSALLDASLSAHLKKLEIERLTGAHITSSF